jgi:hypothetical protein
MADTERISAYKTGGMSPFGQTRKIPAVIEAQALSAAANEERKRAGIGVAAGWQITVKFEIFVDASGRATAVAIAVRDVSERKKWSKLREWLAARACLESPIKFERKRMRFLRLLASEPPFRRFLFSWIPQKPSQILLRQK